MKQIKQIFSEGQSLTLTEDYRKSILCNPLKNCVFSICLNPELKLESLRTKKKEHFKLDEARDYNQVDHLTKNLSNLSMIEDENIHSLNGKKFPLVEATVMQKLTRRWCFLCCPCQNL